MSSHLRIGACSLIACGALALPAGANAADISTAVNQVRAHTDRADAALDRAVVLFQNNSDRKARVAYAKSRREMGLAKADAATARRQAGSPSEHGQAARAQALLAAQQDQNIETLTRALRRADGRDESRIAAAARADTKGREKAIAILTQLLAQVPEQARSGIAKAIANLSTDRVDEVSAMSTALRSSHVSKANKRRVVSTLKTDVEGQTDAATILAALIASPDMPAESKQGLQKAYDNVTAEHGSVADILSRFNSRMPSFVRDFVSKIVAQARTDAQGMRDNHPTGPPAGIPGGAPTTTPGGVPATTPGGPPSSIPAGPPSA
ncbi:MAG: hypothetical protein ACLGI5_00875 [Thermoleophilia bacterium]